MNRVNIYTQTPVTFVEDSAKYVDAILNLAKLTEEFGYTGILVRYGEDKIDPWVLSLKILENTRSIIPLIAIQEDTLPPITNTKMAYGASFLYDRSIYFNLISGTEKQLKKDVSPEARYEGLAEYIEISKALLKGTGNLVYKGKYHSYDSVQSFHVGHTKNIPKFYLSGTSHAGINAAKRVADGFLSVAYPIKDFKKLLSGADQTPNIEIGICLGIVTRPTAREAWDAAKSFFPVTRETRIKALMKRGSKAGSIRYLAELAAEHEVIDQVYWLGGFCSDQTIYPYLVGNYEEVADYLNKYVELGVSSLISCTKPATKEEFVHNKVMFDLLKKKVGV